MSFTKKEIGKLTAILLPMIGIPAAGGYAVGYKGIQKYLDKKKIKDSDAEYAELLNVRKGGHASKLLEKRATGLKEGIARLMLSGAVIGLAAGTSHGVIAHYNSDKHKIPKSKLTKALILDALEEPLHPKS